MKKHIARRIVLVVLISMLMGILAACGGDGTPKVDWELAISGDAVNSPTTLSYADLASMEMIDLTDILMEKSLGENETGSWSGVPIDVLFDKASVGEYTTVTAIASDGYAIEITADEMADAIIAMKKDGTWITEAEPDKGPIRMVCPETPANRWVFQLTELVVNP